MHDLSPALPARRVVSQCVAVFVAAAFALAPLKLPTASASPPGTAGATEIEVLSFASNDAVEEALALTDAMKHALIEAQGVSEHAPGGKGHALEAEALTVGCDDPMSPACAPKMAADLKFDHFIYGTVKKTGANKLTATLNYFNKGDIKTVAKTYDAGPVAKDGASPELKAIALDALYGLVGGPPKSQISVVVTGPAANESGDLYENGQKIGHVSGGHATVELTPGPHTIELKDVSGYSDTSGTIDVGATEATELKLNPVQLAGGNGLDWKLYGGIGSIAVGAVFIGVGVATSLSVHDANSDPTFHQYQERFLDPAKFPDKGVGDVCSQAKAGNPGQISHASSDEISYVADFCDSTHKKQILQWVWYGLGVAFIAGGTVLILTDDHNKSTASGEKAPEPATGKVKVQLVPYLGPHDGYLSLVGTF